MEMSPAVRDAVDALLQQWGKEAALRCIALAYKELPSGQSTFTHADEQDLVFLGVLGLHDPPRPEALNAVHACQEAGIRVIMLTGTALLHTLAVHMPQQSHLLFPLHASWNTCTLAPRIQSVSAQRGRHRAPSIKHIL